MVLILSKESDHTTADVLKWMYRFKQDFVRINGEDLMQHFDLSIDEDQNATLHINNKEIKLSGINAFWYRRGKLNLDTFQKVTIQNDKAVEPILQESIANEIRILETYLHQAFNIDQSIGAYHLRGLNKLSTLNIARQIGLKIPATIVTQRREILADFVKKHSAVITKPIHETPVGKVHNNNLWVYTSAVTEELVKRLPKTFFPSLFQENVAKKYELRIFYLDKKCYGTAIFSQLENTVSVDHRNYNPKRPNRRVPFALPSELVQKLIALMTSLELNCGSIDLIVTPAKEFVFLEVNPIGQFGYTSSIGNFHLEKEIANYLTKASRDY